MKKDLWQKAAESYDAHESKKATKDLLARQQQQQEHSANAAKRQKHNHDFIQTSSTLSVFLASEEGKTAQALLAASRKSVRICEENPGGGYGVVYFIDGQGLRKSIEPMGMWVAYSRNDKEKAPKISAANCNEVASLALRQGLSPDQIMQKICDELDSIAAGAPMA